MKLKKLLILTLISSLFIGCSSKNANHLNIFQFPGSLLGTVNDRKREGVEQYAQTNYEELKSEIERGEGEHLDAILNLAKIKKSNFSSVKQMLKRDYKTIFHNVELTAQPIMQAFGRLYMPKSAKDKTMNGFTYTQAWKIVSKRVDREFEILRHNVKLHKGDVLSKIADDLKIEEKQKRETFLAALDGKYRTIFVDPLVVGVMIHSD